MSKEFQIRDGNLIASFVLENEDGDIDLCKLLKVSHGVAEEIGMFIDYVAINKVIKDQSKQISDLEAKLADLQAEQIKEMQEHQEAMLVADKKIKELEDYYTGYTEALVTEIQELKEQLAEKQKGKIEYTDTINFVETSEPDIVANELDRLNQKLAEKDKEIESLTTDLQEALTLIKEGRELVGLNNKLLEQSHQDKISFCIEQLENVKETTECVLDNALKNCSLNQSYYDRLLGEIDNQIKQLKEKK